MTDPKFPPGPLAIPYLGSENVRISVHISHPSQPVRRLDYQIAAMQLADMQLGPVPPPIDIAGRLLWHMQAERSTALTRMIAAEVASAIVQQCIPQSRDRFIQEPPAEEGTFKPGT